MAKLRRTSEGKRKIPPRRAVTGSLPFWLTRIRYNRGFWNLFMGKDYAGVGYLTGRRLSLTLLLNGTPCGWMTILKFHTKLRTVSST